MGSAAVPELEESHAQTSPVQADLPARRLSDIRNDDVKGADVAEASLGQVPSAASADDASPSGPAGGALAGAFPNPSLAPNSVGANQIATDAVGSSEIAANGVGSAEIDLNAVGTSEIATDGVGNDEIAFSAVDNFEIADDAVGSTELEPDSVGASEIGPGSIHVHESTGVFISGGAAENGAANVETETASCGEGEHLVAGGARWLDANASQQDHEKYIVEILPVFDSDDVQVKGANDSGDDDALIAMAICWAV